MSTVVFLTSQEPSDAFLRQGKVWLTFNSGEYLQNYVYPRHGLPPSPAAAKAFDEFVKHAAEQATE